jgi:hypothetical protein
VAVVAVVGLGAGGVVLRGDVGVEWRTVVVGRALVVAEPNVVDGPLDVVVGASVVVVDDVDEDVDSSTRMRRGLPAELGMPAMAMPSPMQMRRRRTMPARRAAGPCQSMAPEPNDPEFFCGGSIRTPTAGARKGANSNGPVTPYKVDGDGPTGHSNTVPTHRLRG